jgi:hypothetical protein
MAQIETNKSSQHTVPADRSEGPAKKNLIQRIQDRMSKMIFI